MKLKALSLALLALPIASFAEGPVDNYLPQVSFTVESEKNVERDLLRVSLFYQAEGNDLSDKENREKSVNSVCSFCSPSTEIFKR